jgi:hypothetical protein
MLNFARLRNKEITLDELAADLGVRDLHALTDEMINTMLELIVDAVDSDVIFTPEDPEAEDVYAADPVLVNLPWTLGHVIVHCTASGEEGAARAATLARGVTLKERSRYEVPWEHVTTVAQLRHRLEESRRMRHAFLDAWPDQPHLDNLFTPDYPGAKSRNAIMIFLGALSHDNSHLEQIRKLLRQAKACQEIQTS